MAKEIKYEQKTRAALEKGVNQLANTVRVTYETKRKKRCTGQMLLEHR